MAEKGWLLKEIEKDVDDIIRKIGVNNNTLREHILSNVVWRIAELKKRDSMYYRYLVPLVRETLLKVLEFYMYSYKFEYAQNKARYYYEKHYGAVYGSYMYRIDETDEEYIIRLYPSLCEDPELFSHVNIYIPKLTEEEVEKLKKYLGVNDGDNEM